MYSTKYLLRHKCLRKDHFIYCSSLEWHLWHPLILKVTSKSDEMPGSTSLRAARTSSVNNLKTISGVGNNLTYPGSFVSLSNTCDSDLRKCRLNFKNLEIVITYQVRTSQCRRIPLIWVDYSWAKASHAPCVIYANVHHMLTISLCLSLSLSLSDQIQGRRYIFLCLLC